jgi:6-phosphogluconolactonase (cycloisomerase 2 family)
MKIWYWAAVGVVVAAFVVVAAVLAGCKGFWDLPTSTGGGGGTTTTTLSSGYFYVLDKSTSQVISYDISSGTLTLVGTPVAVPAPPIAIAVAPNDQFLYVSTITGGIYLYTISNGVLTLGNSSQDISPDPALAMQVDSTNSWLVETSGQGVLNAVPIVSTGANAGKLNTSAPNCSTQNIAPSIVCTVPLTGATIHQLTIAPNNQYVFVACATNGTEAFTFSAGSSNSSNPFGSVAYQTVGPVTNGTGSARSVAVDPSDRAVYVGEEGATSSGTSGGLRVFTIGTGGALAEVSGSPYASGGTGPYAVLPESSGDYVYVASWNGTSAGIITGFSVSDTNSTFSLTKLSSTASTGVEPMSLAEDSLDHFVLVESQGGNPSFDAYIFDTTTTGQLDLTNTSSTYAGIALAANH